MSFPNLRELVIHAPNTSCIVQPELSLHASLYGASTMSRSDD